jgi:hypothetical protein
MPIKYNIHLLSMRKVGISIFISPDLPLKSIYILSCDAQIHSWH